MDILVADTSGIEYLENGLLKSIDQMRYVLTSLSEKLAQNWFNRQCANSFGSYYLYYTEGDNKHGQLVILESSETDLFPEFKLANPERISTAMSVEQAAYFINETMRKIPILFRKV